MWNNQFIHFFYLTLIDEEKVIPAANEALEKFQKLRNAALRKNLSVCEERFFVESCFWSWSRHRYQSQIEFWCWYQQNKDKVRKQSLFKSLNVSIEPWVQIQKTCRPEELLCLLWKEVFQISEHKIGEALALTEGAIRYRISHGLHALGELTLEKPGQYHG
jgi:hypothetical protein